MPTSRRSACVSYPIPHNEDQRLAALRALQILDTEYEERFDRITRLAQRLFGTEMAAVTLVDSDRQWFKSRQGPLDPETSRDDSFCTYAITDPDHTLVVGDATRDDRFFDKSNVTGAPHIRFYAGHTISAPGGEPIGALCVIDSHPRATADFDSEALRDLAAMVEDEIASLAVAIGDSLTGLSNRRGFDTLGGRLMDIARRIDVPIAVVYADVDNLKPINDEFGHEAGDAALIEISEILETTLRESDVIARVGGDEFCALLADAAATDAMVVADRIESAIAARNASTDRPYELAISVGISQDRPATSGRTLNDLIEDADARMLAAKRTGHRSDPEAA